MNSVNITGRFVSDPDVREVGGKKKGRVRVAVQETKDKASFFEVIYWERSAELLQEYAKKGAPASVNGRLTQETWEKDGTKHEKIVIISNNYDFPITDRGAGDSGAKSSAPAPKQKAAPAPAPKQEVDDDFF